jgi:malate permease and related proteins
MVLSTFLLSSTAALLMYAAGKYLFADATRNLAAQAACTANTGYFGVPVFLALFPAEQLGVYMLAMVGVSVAEATVGFALLARGRYTWADSLRRLIRLPLLYAATAGLAVNLLGLPGHPVLWETLERVKGTYVVLGMMMVGFGLAGVRSLALDWRLIGVLLAQKIFLWPLLALGILAVDTHTVGLFDPLARNCLLLIALMPLAANTVAFATQLRIYPEKAATAVLISSLIALVTVPLGCLLFF